MPGGSPQQGHSDLSVVVSSHPPPTLNRHGAVFGVVRSGRTYDATPPDRLIEAGDRKALARRTYATAPLPPDLRRNPRSRKAVMAVIVELHDKFFLRTADPERGITLQLIPIR